MFAHMMDTNAVSSLSAVAQLFRRGRRFHLPQPGHPKLFFLSAGTTQHRRDVQPEWYDVAFSGRF